MYVENLILSHIFENNNRFFIVFKNCIENDVCIAKLPFRYNKFEVTCHGFLSLYELKEDDIIHVDATKTSYKNKFYYKIIHIYK